MRAYPAGGMPRAAFGRADEVGERYVAAFRLPYESSVRCKTWRSAGALHPQGGARQAGPVTQEHVCRRIPDRVP